MRKILGIDEAGRGSVFGSMFIAGVLIKEKDMEKLRKLRVRDSKELEPKKRDEMAKKIMEMAEKFVVKEITATEIDSLRKFASLNEIEIRAFAQIIEELLPNKAFIDMPDVNNEKFLLKLRAKIKKDLGQEIEIIAENFADKKYPVVSAASIIAKYMRERHLDRLRRKYQQDFVTGYSHDEKTLAFMENYLKKNKKLPEETRKSWETTKRIIEKYLQKNLLLFSD